MAKAVPRTVLITGCSSGIGLCMAVQLARDPGRRFHVIATMRDLRKKDKLEAAAGDTLNQTLTIQRLDVCSDESVAECINSLPEKQLDVLVNNAGVGLIGPLETISIDAMKHIFETNFFGAIRMIKAVLPAMKQRQKGHIVVISSVMGLQGIPFNDVYAASKFAIEGFCESLAVQLLKFNIFISLVEPGPINTEFEMKLMEEVAKSQFPGVDATTVHCFKEAVVNVIAKERPPFRTQTNPLYTPLVALKYADTSGELSVSAYYNLLFRFTRLFYICTSFLKCITCRCFRRQITPT
ncbi:hypothetical protein E2320_016337 [Naja naja]|nr:hypothetical protein E2320_016337 [Naja naja]